MKKAITVLAVLLGLLSMAAGAAKVALVPEEVEFLRQFRFTDALVISFGAVQILSGLLLIIPATRFYGSLVSAAGFALSTGLLLYIGNWAFGSVSLIPVVLSLFITYHSISTRVLPEASRSED